MMQETGILPTDINNPQAIKDKLTQAMTSSQVRLGQAQNHWLAWEGTPYMGALPDVKDLDFDFDGDDGDRVPEEDFDVEDETYEKFKKLSLEDQKIYIEEQKKKALEISDDEKTHSYLEEEGFLDKPGVVPGITLAAYGAYSQKDKVYKLAADGTKNIINWLGSNTKLPTKDIVTILESDIVSKTTNNLSKKLTEIADLEDIIKKSSKWDPYLKKNVEVPSAELTKNKIKLKKLNDQATKFRQTLMKDIKKYHKIKISKADLTKLLENPSKYSLSNIRASLSQIPGGINNWFKANNLVKFTTGTLKGVGQVRAYSAVGETLGLDNLTEFVGKDVLGMDAFEQDKLLNDLVTTGSGAWATWEAVKKGWPLMMKLALSEKGRYLLGKVLSESTIKRMAAAKVAPHPYAKIGLSILGLGLTGYDLAQFFSADVENMSESEIDEHAYKILGSKLEKGDDKKLWKKALTYASPIFNLIPND
jgi:hypothetical protein